MMLTRTFIATLLAVTFSLYGVSVSATVVDLVAEGNVLNADFETDAEFDEEVPSTDGTSASSISNWDIYHPNGRVDSDSEYGIWTPTNYYDDSVSKLAFLDLISADAAAPGEDGQYVTGLQQTLTKTSGPGEEDYSKVRGNSRYELGVQVGNPKTGNCCYYDGFGGYRVELLAIDGPSVEVIKSVEGIGSADNGSVPIPEGRLQDVSLVVLSHEIDVGLLGKALGIRLIHKNAIEQPSMDFFWWGMGFDNVSLSVSAVPVPAAVWLFGTALLGLIGFSKRRKTEH